LTEETGVKVIAARDGITLEIEEIIGGQGRGPSDAIPWGSFAYEP
jgi:hypothetical protein